jgi:peptidoglycan/LPS O-acetylase OafA/YrhL
VFTRGPRTRILLLVAVSIFVGPKILLLLPAWAVGAGAFHAGRRFNCSARAALLLFVVTTSGVVVSLLFENQLGLNNGKVGQPPLYYSFNSLGDNLFALILAVNFFCCALFSKHFSADFEPHRAVRFIRWMASHTFSLYLYHVPLLFFIRAITKYDPQNRCEVAAALAVALVIISGLSKITEEQYPRLRTRSRRWMTMLVERVRLRRVKPDLLSDPQKS